MWISCPASFQKIVSVTILLKMCLLFINFLQLSLLSFHRSRICDLNYFHFFGGRVYVVMARSQSSNFRRVYH